MADSPAVAEWRARHPGWFAIPATFYPRTPDRPAEMRTPEEAPSRRRSGPPPPRPGGGKGWDDPVRAFCVAYEATNNPALAMQGRLATPAPPNFGNIPPERTDTSPAAMDSAPDLPSRLRAVSLEILRDLSPIGTAQAAVVINSYGDRHAPDPGAARAEIMQNLPELEAVGGDFWGITPNYIYRAYILPNGDFSIGTYYPR